MAKQTTKAKSSKKSGKGASTKTKFSTVKSTRRSTALLFVVVFAVLGTILLLRSLASPSLPPAGKDIVAAYINSVPIAIAQGANDTPDYLSYGASTLVLADGTVLCDDGNSAGDVQTATISNGQVKQIQNSIKGIDLSTVPKVSSAAPSVRLDVFEGFYVADGSSTQGYSVYPGAQKPEKLAHMQNILQSACSGTAQVKQRGTVPYNLPNNAQISETTKKTLIAKAAQNIGSLVFPKASAQQPPYSTTYDQNVVNSIFNQINAYRGQYNKASLIATPCLHNAATNWASHMAAYDVSGDDPNLRTDIANACGYSNVGVAADAGVASTVSFGSDIGAGNAIFNAWVGEPLCYGVTASCPDNHRINILSYIKYPSNIKFNRVGVGAYVNTYNNSLYIEVFFAQW